MRNRLGLLAAMLLLVVSLPACAPAPDAVPSGGDTQEAAGAPTGSDSQEETAVSNAPAEAEIDEPDEGTSDEQGDSPSSESQVPNFRLLISDEKNDIEDFSALWIRVVGLGLVQGDEEGVEEQWFETDHIAEVNLRELEGDRAVETWVGYVESGDYVKVFLYVDEVWGTFAEGVGEEGDEPVIKLPSEKLQLTLPVRIEEADEEEEETEGAEEPMAEFVFDITVHRAGNSGQYILSPQASESGQGKTYRLLEHTEERIIKGKPEFTGKREDTGKPEWAAQPGGRGLDDEEENESEDA